jgi:long-chain fatty acid transport protein
MDTITNPQLTPRRDRPSRRSHGISTSAWTLLFFCAAMLLRPDSGQAVAFRLPNQDPEGIARGNAFAATADNPSAIYYNPAGITQLESNSISAGLYLISANSEFTSPSGQTARTDRGVQAVPQLYYVLSLTNLPLSFGFGVYAPYGLGLDWGANTPIRTAAMNGKLLYATVNPVIAWKVLPSLSVAIGPTINYSQVQFERGISPAPGSDSFKFRGDGADYGFNAGIRWQPYEMWAFGLNYRSATEIDYSGHSSTSPNGPFPYYPYTPTHASLRFPQSLAGGISFRPTPNWNIEFDLDWTDWANVNEIVFRGTPYHGTPIGDPVFPLNYTSSLMYEFGVTRQLGNGYFVSAGYIYSENSSPDKYYNPIIPDGNLHLGSVGFGHRGQTWNWAFGYHFAYNPGREITDNVNPLVNGTYRTFNNAINISVTYKF